MTSNLESDLEDALGTLPLTAKIALLSGSGLWFTQEEPALGLPRIALSDGPVGVRGHRDSEAATAVNLPSGSAMAASWDRNLMRRVGQLLASEARRQDVAVVLGPTINLHRSPLAGRNFECFSEDPLLTGELASAYVTGIQGEGIGACPKHFVANEAETDRMEVNNAIDERTLHEVYLAPFERVVSQSQPWMIMAAYNGVNGKAMTENKLTEDPLKSDWGFDGVVVSDWHAVYSTVESALSSTDLAMPGPEKHWGAKLLDAVTAGKVPESAIDEKIRRILRLGRRVQAGRRRVPLTAADGGALAREAASTGFVLLENRNRTLPLHSDELSSLALIGPAALAPRTQGGGSASVFPSYSVGPAAGLRSSLGDGVHLTTVQGAWLSLGLRDPRTAELQSPHGAGPVRLTWTGTEGTIAVEHGTSTTLTRGRDAIPAGATAVAIETIFTPNVSGTWQLGFKGIGLGELAVDGKPHTDADTRSRFANIGEVLTGAPEESAEVELAAGCAVHLRLNYTWHPDAVLFRVGLAVAEPRKTPEEEIVEAVKAATAAQVAVVMVGTSEAVESEGFDRTSLALPGYQDDLVRAVVRANPRTIVVVNAGSPVEMPWRHDAAAVVLLWFPGMEFGNALAEVLLGRREPGGRLPTTWPASLAEAPVSNTAPVDGTLNYSERLNVGHRGWASHWAAPAYWLGHGLGYTTFEVEGYRFSDGRQRPDGSIDTVLTVRNTGDRSGKYVAQIYADAPNSEVDRPSCWLAGFATAQIPAGEKQSITVNLPARPFEYWQVDNAEGTRQGWTKEATAFRLAPAADAGRAAAELCGPFALTLNPT